MSENRRPQGGGGDFDSHCTCTPARRSTIQHSWSWSAGFVPGWHGSLVFAWTQPKHKYCGWVPCSSCLMLDSTLLMCLFCSPLSVFSSQPATWRAWWLTADCHCQSMLPLFNGAAFCVNRVKPPDACPWMPPGRSSRLSLPVAWTAATHCTIRHHLRVNATCMGYSPRPTSVYDRPTRI